MSETILNEDDLTHVIHNYVLPEYEDGTVDISDLTDKYVDLSKRYSDQFNRINEIDEKLDNVDKTLSDKDKSLERKLKDASASILIIVICIVGFGLLLIWLTVDIDKRLTYLESKSSFGSVENIENGVLPCPMCGSTNIVIYETKANEDDRKENVGLGDIEYYRIHCDGCNLETGSECNKEDLIYRWNHIDR